MLQRLTAALPWWAKILAKLILSRFFIGYRFWQRLGLFKHGGMEQPESAFAVFKSHFDRAAFARRDEKFVALELGPGDTVFLAMLARAHGASETHLVDNGSWARDDIAPYLDMERLPRTNGFDVPEVIAVRSLDDLLAQYGAH